VGDHGGSKDAARLLEQIAGEWKWYAGIAGRLNEWRGTSRNSDRTTLREEPLRAELLGQILKACFGCWRFKRGAGGDSGGMVLVFFTTAELRSCWHCGVERA